MKRSHVHAWRMVSPHPFGAVTKYQCTSCPVFREQKRLSEQERMEALSAQLGFADAADNMGVKS